MLVVVARVIMFAAKRFPAVRTTELRLAIANIHRPGALTPSVVLSLGLGLSLLVALALGYLVFGDWPDRVTFIGAGLVVATGLFTLWRERKMAEGRPSAN